MRKYMIESRDGIVIGTYEGNTPEAALAALANDAGEGIDVEGQSTVGTINDWHIYTTG